MVIMIKKYSIPANSGSRVQELPTITATVLKNSTADVLDQLAPDQAVAITRHNKPRAVLLTVDHYDALMAGQTKWLAELHEEYRGMLAKMQTREQKAAALRLFRATPEELGAAAVREAQNNAVHSK